MPDEMNAESDLQLAFEVADRAAELALTLFGTGVTAAAKADGTPVTEADLAVEALLRELLTAARPGDALLGEEHGLDGQAERVWILDPIDGTGFFSNGDPNWRIHVALEVGGTTELAVVTSPALGLRWWASRGSGAFECDWPAAADPRRLAVSTTTVAKHAALDAIGSPGRDALPHGFRPPASPLPLIDLVRGQVDGFLAERYYKWDHAPWILLVQEAGGRFTDPTGGCDGGKGGGFYSNAALHDELVQVLGYPQSVR